MKILVVHNSYKQPGGEDVVVRRESGLLRAAGHQVVTYFRHNEEIEESSLLAKITAGSKTIWAHDSYRDLAALLKQEKPNLAHFHNTLPLVSPSAYYACLNANVPVVQTLHNYLLLCPGGTLFRSGHICEDCLGHSLWRGVKHGCYRDSRAGTAAVSLMLTAHRAFGTWGRAVSCYIAISECVRERFIAQGLSGKNVFVKQNFVDPDPSERSDPGGYALFVGRLSAEKGLRTLVAAWAELSIRIPLVIVGDGPLRLELEREVIRRNLHHVRFEGQVPQEKSLAMMKGARFLVFPSEWHEPFGLAIVEAFACGVPVVCSALGAMSELVADGQTGLHFVPGNPADLRAKLEWAWTHTKEMEAMGHAARTEYEKKYTASENYRILMMVYEFALRGRDSNEKSRLH
jgi:glycosyltransferase involved in cell wall biosynthesis